MFSINILVSNFVLISVLTEGIIVYFRVERELLTDLYNIALLVNCGSRKRDKRRESGEIECVQSLLTMLLCNHKR